MTAAQYQGNGWLFHSRNQLSNGKSCFHITADRIENNHQSFDGRSNSEKELQKTYSNLKWQKGKLLNGATKEDIKQWTKK